MKLKRINSELYATEDGYTLKKGYVGFGKNRLRVNRLYDENGCYLGMPETIATANEYIKEDRKEKKGR